MVIETGRVRAGWLSAALTGALVASPAASQPAFQTGEFGGWTVEQLDQSCAMWMEYEGAGDTRLYLFHHADGGRFIIVDNHLWSVKSGETFEIKVSLNGYVYTLTAEGSEVDGKRGIVFAIGPAFIKDFVGGSGLTLRRGDVIIDDLSLKGTSLGAAALARCHANLARQLAAAKREKERLAHIPGDPFAPTASENETVDLGTLVATRDAIPAAAARAGASGKVYFRAVIDATGALKECRIVKASGFAALDAETCAYVAQRKPWAASATGSGDETIFSGAIDWRP